MSKETYTIPTGPNARYDFQRNVIEICSTNATAWKISADRIAKILPLQTDYQLKYGVANNKSTQSPAATAAREASWTPLEAALCDLFEQELINNDDIPVDGKNALGIHVSAVGGGTPASAPTTSPIITLAVAEISVLHVVFADSASPASHSKPTNVAFCELAYKVDAPAPATPSDCSERVNISRSREALVFDPAQRGKTVYAFARWVNRNGKVGPWSGLVTAIVP